MNDKAPYKVGVYTVNQISDDRMKQLVTASAVYFALAKLNGWDRKRAIREFWDSPLCAGFGLELTVGDIWAFADAAGLER